ncbi:hypothetical protein JCM10908_000790 [Rhodotorula pacifica]|uniref:uncharacterized protein n=1 Tax=Rhodotorula pacifica TaxID=1495444 RepID=UPI00318284E4
MASNGFAPPPPAKTTAVDQLVNKATTVSSSSPNSNIALYTRLVEALLVDLRTLTPRQPTHEVGPLADALRKADSWASLRLILRAKLGPPGTALLQGDVAAVKHTGHVILAALDRIGAAKLAQECSDREQDEVRLQQGGSATVGTGTSDVMWTGICDLMAWLSAVRSALTGEAVSASTGTQSITLPSAVKLEAAESASPVPVSPAPSFGFAPPPQAGELAKKLSGATPVPILPPSAPTNLPPAQQRAPSLPAAQPTQQHVRTASAPSSVTPAPTAAPKPIVPTAASDPGSKAAAFALRMSGLAGDIAPIASTSTAALPTGPPSAGFAPPPGPGASAFDKKPAKSRKPRVSAPAAAGTASPSETRPKRERKPSLQLRESSIGESPPLLEGEQVLAGGSAAAPAQTSKKRFTSYEEPSGSDAGMNDDDAELDELASDYEEQLERKRRKVAAGDNGNGSGKKRPRKPRDSAAVERERQRALIAKEEAELAKDPKRFKVGQAVIARFPNYSYWPAMVLDPLTAPPKTQGTRVKGSYLVKSIPTGADHRWVPPDDSSILPVTTTQLDDIILGRYKSAPPPSWKKWRGELVDAAMMIKDEDRLKEWFANPTPTELWQMAQAEKKKAARASNAW